MEDKPVDGGDSKHAVALKLRTEAERRADIASRMRFGKSRACEFAYIAGLNDAADLLDGDRRSGAEETG